MGSLDYREVINLAQESQVSFGGVLSLSVEGTVGLITLTEEHNRIDEHFVPAFNAALDLAEKHAITALVVHNNGNVWCSGYDLSWLQKLSDDARLAALEKFQALCRRVLLLPVPTVAALNGHAVAAGAILALCFDFRVMRQDYGYFWLSQLQMGMAYPKSIASVVKAKLHPNAVRDAAVFGRRLAAQDALRLGVIDAAGRKGEVQSLAVKLSMRDHPSDMHINSGYTKYRESLVMVKSDMYDAVARALEIPPSHDDPAVIAIRSRL